MNEAKNIQTVEQIDGTVSSIRKAKKGYLSVTVKFDETGDYWMIEVDESSNPYKVGSRVQVTLCTEDGWYYEHLDSKLID